MARSSQLSKSEARLEAIVRSITECIKSVDQDCRLVDMNPAGLALIGANCLGQVKGANVLDLIDPAYHETFKEGVRRVFAGETVDQQFQIISFDGTRRWMHQMAVPFRDPDGDGSVTEMIAVTRDVTARVEGEIERERLKEEAIIANKAKSEFLANMSHEIRTPLNGVMGMAQLLQMSSLDSHQHHNLKILISSGSSLLSIIDDILDVSKIEAGMMTFQETPFSLRSTIAATRDAINGVALMKGLTVEIDIAPGLPDHVLGDEARVRQILLNLVGNAVKFTETGGVQLKAFWNDGRFRADVIDSGPGVPKNKRDQIFDRFRQASEGLTRTSDGSGLGLAICKELAALADGSVGLADTQPEQGAHFWLDIALPEAKLNVAA